MEVLDPHARVADLVGLLYSLETTFNGKTDLYMLEKEMEVDLDDLMPIVHSANTLGFITVGEGDIIITDKGLEFLKSNIKKRKEMIRDSLRRIEPFKTAIELKEFTIEQLKNVLQKKGIQLYNSPEGLYDLQITLVEWGVYSGLLKKEGEKFLVVTT
ncbi:ABC transporter ATP-binding protein [Sulfolobus sp. A20-N-F6]|uniref:AAA-associated domain-containing protein n=1 Tax=Saccharolobus sp. A20 TaxID=1891280 RepID=UPI000846187B|nr:AAA-associated domain-containing protein [Sulfolobus sp. A20]TRM76439.1 ABC transporter ATP-binding protein [Sulfolobus sp. A20-N-F8]TRM80076.1 ABC transporter ATP-binding protein [Sulfolobus sp. D5]TRM83294.1 ABC transporter ATP-binding protein [Sulfolobus sp. A20-N-F6]TRM84996.1 ABC transporter ATP-binding protein [Sulfolobus sp. F3]TRM89763.1 ABC transporter ATP-binding protein [Sulfolobus sp. C3]TRM98555.1 ABC transporter ATP-binding protein [Sulfolobus sp. E1]TRN02440.1 ABC transport